MKTFIAAIVATTALVSPVLAQDTIDEFRIGILGGENAQDRMASNECYRAKAEELLGVPVKLFTPADYDGVIQGLLGGTIDMAWLGASAYAKTYLTDPDAVEPIMVKTNVDKSYGYYSIGFARKDSGIASLEDMKGKVFAFGDPNSTSGYLIPSIEIPREIDASMESGDYFGEVKFVGGHEQTIVAVANGDVDAGVTWADGMGAWAHGRMGRRLQLRRAAQGLRCGPRGHEPDGRDLEVEAHSRRPDRAAHRPAGAGEGRYRHDDRVAALHGWRLRLQFHGR